MWPCGDVVPFPMSSSSPLPDLSWLAGPARLIGMVHVGALPGSPRSARSIAQLADQAAAEATVLVQTGFRAVMIENMHDAPYVNGPHTPEVTAAMTAVGLAVRHAVGPDVVLGVQVLSAGAPEALAVALACGACFVRVENFVFSHVADEGLMPDAAAGPLLRYRRAIHATHIALFADIKKKHASHALTADVPIHDAAHAADLFGADGLIVTGSFTGRPADECDLRAVRAASRLPTLVGSGITPANVRAMLNLAHGAVVGSWIKDAGVWSNPVNAARARELIAAADN